jgi:signal peptidase II
MNMPASKYGFLAVVAGSVLVLDQAAKALILARLPLGASRPVIRGLFDLTHVHNPGGAFGFLAQARPELRSLLFVAVSILAAGMVVYLYRQTPAAQRGFKVGLALILGGALGNLIDRLRFGVVVDFLDFYVGAWHWPAFNIADSAITIGVCLFALQALFGGKSAG